MTDRYAQIRKALAKGPTQGPWGATHGDAYLIAACDPDTIRALLAERDALREALEVMVEMVEMNGFGRAYAMDVARAALAASTGQEVEK